MRARRASTAGLVLPPGGHHLDGLLVRALLPRVFGHPGPRRRSRLDARPAKEGLQHTRVEAVPAAREAAAVARPLRVARRPRRAVCRDHAEREQHASREAAEHKRGENDDGGRRGDDRPAVRGRDRLGQSKRDRAAQADKDEEPGLTPRERALLAAARVGEQRERRHDKRARERHGAHGEHDEGATGVVDRPLLRYLLRGV
mmetsp:Transcript_3198/g.8474  ORF Transcript_3198/g.8474 Transcript_3198/m.8474 type:complete len:201 (-) Transcript_3198:790-1392(-)